MVSALSGIDRNVPVVNLLSDFAHPCQALADLITMHQVFGPTVPMHEALRGRILTYVGDANNVARSLGKAAISQGMHVRIASPVNYSFDERDLAQIATAVGHEGSLMATDDPKAAALGADVLYTDVWTSMGQEEQAQERMRAFAGFQVDAALVGLAQPDAIVLHCLPAHRGEEIAADVLEGSHSAVWRQARNRMVAMRGLFAWLAEDDVR
jgi:ornithine carbamoyltransferase